MKKFFLALIIAISSSSFASQNIRIVGSATVYPFMTIAAEIFGKEEGNVTPIIEATGTGGGLNLICKAGISKGSPDIVDASRPVKQKELKLCAEHNIKHLKEIAIGYDGIVFARSNQAKSFSIEMKELFLGISDLVPDKNGNLIKNPYKRWNEINPALPDIEIMVYGPSSTSGTRDLVNSAIIKAFADTKVRQDGHYIEMPENYNLVINKLSANHEAIGIIGYSFLENSTEVNALSINNTQPTYDNIRNGSYPLARKLYIYVNIDKYNKNPQLEKFVKFVQSPLIIGKNGYLAKRGLITLD